MNDLDKKSDESAFPCCNENTYIQYGISKREYFTALAMQGICVNTGRNAHTFDRPCDIAETAIKIDDEVLKQLKNE